MKLLRVYEGRVLRRIFGPKKEEVMGEWQSCIMKSFIICVLQQIKSRKMRQMGCLAHMGQMGNA
jgi:hypothetical protein